MPYEVLARKWRPRTFEELVGQEHVVRALANALGQGRLHHAYLFSGTRGVGKTTIARILAKCLNCEGGVTATPCGQCNACQTIDQGRFIDLIEVDAASRTKVEDTRELLENVQYAPTSGRYKIYLIDEVHMLSGHSFNALLKTLEEPPPHVKFLLATTDPQRLPVTVLSRCLQFHLKNMSADCIATHLQHILEQENVSFEGPALSALGRAATGSMRDALSLLDQAIAYGNGTVQTTDVNALLGTIEHTHLFQVLTALIDNDAPALLKVTADLAEQGVDYASVLDELLSLLHQITVAQVAPSDLDPTQTEHQQLTDLAKQLTAEEVQLYYQIAAIGRRDLGLAPTPRTGLEMTLLRMFAFSPTQPDTKTHPASVKHQRTTPPPKQQPAIQPPKQPKEQTQAQPPAKLKPTTTDTQTQPTTSDRSPAAQQHVAPPPTEKPEPKNPGPDNLDWANILPQLNLTGMALALASHCSLQSITDTQIRLLLEPKQAPLLQKSYEQRIGEALDRHLGKSRQLKITTGKGTTETPATTKQREQDERLKAAKATIENDANIQAIIESFDATIVPDSIQGDD